MDSGIDSGTGKVTELAPGEGVAVLFGQPGGDDGPLSPAE
jgi:hypothetical protein